jgi:ADP-heptose:LPS heptosyltransferase
MHLAAASGAATLGLFGPSLASEYAPSGRLTAVALAEGRLGAAAMESLPLEAVLRTARALLGEAAQTPCGLRS